MCEGEGGAGRGSVCVRGRGCREGEGVCEGEGGAGRGRVCV